MPHSYLCVDSCLQLVRQPGGGSNPVEVDCLRHIIRMVVETNALAGTVAISPAFIQYLPLTSLVLAAVAIVGLVVTLAAPVRFHFFSCKGNLITLGSPQKSEMVMTP